MATEKALVPEFVLTLGTKSRLELDDRSCLSACLAVNGNVLVARMKLLDG